MNGKIISDLVEDLKNEIHHPFQDIRNKLKQVPLMEWFNCPLFNKPGFEVFAPTETIAQFHSSKNHGSAAFKIVGHDEVNDQFIIAILWIDECDSEEKE